MATINEYIDQLKSDKSDLKTNLQTKGITGLTSSDTFTQLVPKVLDIPEVQNQNKEVTMYSNGNVVLEPDSGYTGLGTVSVTVDVAPDLTPYFKTNLSEGAVTLIKKFPSNMTNSLTSWLSVFSGFKGLEELPLMNTSSVTTFEQAFRYCTSITTAPLYNTSNVSSFRLCFSDCSALTSVPLLDLSHATTCYAMFDNCTSLTTVPAFNVSSVNQSGVGLNNMFRNCPNLSNDSINNILAMCTTAVSFTGTKNLSSLGLGGDHYSASMIEGLSNYQAFVTAGWSIGWS